MRTALILQIVQVLTLIVIAWSTWESYKIRKTAQQQLKNQLRPVLSFIPQHPAYVIKNVSGNPALNVLVFSKRPEGYFIKATSEHVISILPSNSDSGNNFQIHSQETKISRKELLSKFSWAKNLVKVLETEEQNMSRFVICYEDVLGNKLYTFINSSGTDYDFAGKTGYV